jgi:GNAT superfamily N-acetyltransferase
MSQLSIVPYEPAMASQLTRVYNEAVQGVPHCYPIDVKDWISALNEEGGALRRDESALVAVVGGSVLGYAHLAIGRARREDPDERGLVRFFWYQRGQRAVGQVLLEAAEAYLVGQGANEILMFPQQHRYPFYYLPSAFLSDRLGQVPALLGLNGYRRVQGEVYMDWPDYEPVLPSSLPIPIELSLEWQPGRGERPGLVLRALLDSRQVGTCHCSSCGEYADAAGVQDWCFVTWIGVEEDIQGQGLGRALLQRALWEMHGAGYRHTAISTAWRNYRAALFYTNLGYEVIDWTYAYGRDLRPQDGP